MTPGYHAHAHLMGLTFASIRLSTAAVIGFLAFRWGVYSRAAFVLKSHYFFINIVKSLTLICEYHLNETGRSVQMSRSFAEIESLNLSAEWYRLRSFFLKILE